VSGCKGGGGVWERERRGAGRSDLLLVQISCKAGENHKQYKVSQWGLTVRHVDYRSSLNGIAKCHKKVMITCNSEQLWACFLFTWQSICATVIWCNHTHAEPEIIDRAAVCGPDQKSSQVPEWVFLWMCVFLYVCICLWLKNVQTYCI